MSNVIVLTDSSAYLPEPIIRDLPVRVIPLTLTWDGQTYRDGIDIQADEFYTRLSTSDSLPQTSQLSAHELKENLDVLLDAGHEVLVLPISSGISSSYETATSVVRDYPADRVALVDSRFVSMALGFQVLAAARAAAGGAGLKTCEQIARHSIEHTGVYFTVNTLKYLAAGGRINSAKRLMGAALNIKPILEIREGKIELVGSVISQRKAIQRMLDLVEEGIAGRTPVRLSVFHSLARATADEVMEAALARFKPVEMILTDISPVVGSHVGPGTVCVAYQAGDFDAQ